jgi:Ca-activated chloride channel family protein
MRRDNLFAIARAELTGSLKKLSTAALVQVVCYNTEVRLPSSAESRQPLLRNTTREQRLIAQFLQSIEPDGGTDRVRALQAAFRLNPDVIFFLTDADEPRLYPADLEALQRENRSRAALHVIEFGAGPLLQADNFLMQLARRNRGHYRYCDVAEFRQIVPHDASPE